MVREHHVAVLPANHINAFCMGPTTNTQSYAKCTYVIGWEHSHVVLPDHASLFHQIMAINKYIYKEEQHQNDTH